MLKILLHFSLFILIFTNVCAEGVEPDGAGTEADPYQVAILDNLLWISTNNSSWDKYFIQTSDIDAADTQNWNSGEGFSPIGNDACHFTGYYNGQEHVIENLFISRPSENYQGLWGHISDGSIKNISLINIEVTGAENVGGLVGLCSYNSVENCSVTGSITGYISVGGLVGWSNGATINSCYSSGTVEGDTSVGGLVGANYFQPTITDCYSSSQVIGVTYVGGLVGQNGYAEVHTCFSIGAVSGNDNTGGLVGGGYSSVVEDCFWDIQTSGQATSTGGTGKTTAEMQIVSTFTEAGWDFVDNPAPDIHNNDFWNMDGINNSGYPFLSRQQFSSPLAAYFTTDCVCTNQGYPVQFTDLSTGISTSWYWDFDNDGNYDSYDENPEWFYPDAGTYSISLTIQDDAGTSNSFKENYLIIIPDISPLGNGTEESPYLIENVGNLVWISSNPDSWDKYYLQTEDIDAACTHDWFEGAGFPAIGKSVDESFSGTYNGQDHNIDNLYMYQPDTWFQGFFGFLLNATIENLGMTNANITGTDYCGGLAGRSQSSSVSNCFSSGYVSGESSIGGLIGHNHINSFLTTSYSTASVNGSCSGVLVGYNQMNSTITNCYSRGSAEGTEIVGGLVGYCGGTSDTESYIDKCYSTSSVIGSGEYIGGLVGCDNYGGVISNSFWDIETSGQTTSAGGTGKSTAAMQNVATYTSSGTVGLDEPWDFLGNPYDDIGDEDYWDMSTGINDGYPYLANPYMSIDEGEVIDHNPDIPELIGNFPNPFDAATRISFSIPVSSTLELSVYNIKGERIKILSNNEFSEGLHSIIWDGKDESGKTVRSGVYLYKLKVSDETELVKKCILMK